MDELCSSPPRPPAPSDVAAERGYEELVKRAAELGLVVGAYGGVATLAIPSEQRKHGLRAAVLEAIQCSDGEHVEHVARRERKSRMDQ